MTYKNISDQDLFLPGIGIVKAGAEVKVQEPLNNANFELVESKRAEKPKAEDKVESKTSNV